jgi:thioredoxin-dependent peroxiredoxin
MNKINVGDKIPLFKLPDQNDELVNINDILGKKDLVLYFYPKNETAGCTKEACAFRDSYEDFIDAGAEVIGISSDDSKSHSSFAKNHRLPFTLLSDENNEIRKLFGVPTNFLGLLPGRVTYIIDKNGIVKHIFSSQLNIDKHITEALEVLKA